MTIDQVKQHIAKASAFVATWPKWKQNILANNGKPTRSEPRTIGKERGV